MLYARLLTLLVVVALSVSTSFGGVAAGADPTVTVKPDKTVLSAALIKEPITIIGSGWKPDEPVVVNLKVPKGVTVKGNPPGVDVGIAGGQANEKGEFAFTVDATTVLMTFLQADWDNAKMKPDFSKATPLPPGDYTVEAVGFVSNARAKFTLTLLPAPKKEN